MKLSTYCSLFVLLTLLALPMTADAFSRRTHHSEAGSSHVTTLSSSTEPSEISPEAVPEPPALLLMGMGLGLFAVGSALARFRGRAASHDKAL